MISAFIYLFCRSLSEIAGNKQAEGAWMGRRFPPRQEDIYVAKGQKQRDKEGGGAAGEDKEMTQAYRTDGFLSDVIIRLLASFS